VIVVGAKFWCPWAQCVGGYDVLRFTCCFGSWKHHTRRLDPPVGLPPSTRGRSTAFDGREQATPAEHSIQHPATSAICKIYSRKLAKLVARRHRPRAESPSHTTAAGGAHAAICRPRGGFAKQKL
jgi:hypothetical protein